MCIQLTLIWSSRWPLLLFSGFSLDGHSGMHFTMAASDKLSNSQSQVLTSNLVEMLRVKLKLFCNCWKITRKPNILTKFSRSILSLFDKFCDTNKLHSH